MKTVSDYLETFDKKIIDLRVARIRNIDKAEYMEAALNLVKEQQLLKIEEELKQLVNDDQAEALKDFINSIALYKENDGQRELTAIKLSDFEKLKELYNMIKF